MLTKKIHPEITLSFYYTIVKCLLGKNVLDYKDLLKIYMPPIAKAIRGRQWRAGDHGHSIVPKARDKFS